MSSVDWSRVRAVLFDAVGTVIHPFPTVVETYHAAAMRFGSRLPADVIRSRFSAAFARQTLDEPTTEARELERWRNIVGAVIDDVGVNADDVFDHLWHGFASANSWRMFADVPEAIAVVRRYGLRCGIASNFDTRLRTVVAGHPPLAALELFVSSELGFSKPARGFFTAVESRLRLPPEAILLLGDDLQNDVEGARAAGWQALHLDRAAGGTLTDLLRRV